MYFKINNFAEVPKDSIKKYFLSKLFYGSTKYLLLFSSSK